MGKRITVITITTLVLSGCASPTFHGGSAGHVIVPSARQIAVLVYDGECQPEEAQAARLENALARLFARPDKRLQGYLIRPESRLWQAPFPLSDYFIRYCGVIKEGKRLIVGQATHRQVFSGFSHAQRLPGGDEPIELRPYGGGVYFFTVVFDPEANRVVELLYNAPL